MSTKPTERFLPMFDIDQQKLLRGSVNSSSTNIVQQGLLDALVRLFQLTIEVWQEQPLREVTETDDLETSAIGRTCYQKLIGLPDLAEPSTEVTELRDRFQTLKGLRAGKASRLLRDVESAARSAVVARIEPLREAIEAAVGSSPHRTREVIEEVRTTLQTIELTEPQSEPLAQFGWIIRGMIEVNRHRTSLPQKTIEFVERQLTERAQPLYDRALLALAEERVTEELRREISELKAFLDELSGLGVEFVKGRDAVQAAMEERRAETIRASKQSRASVLLEIKGASESEILAGLLSRQKCQDQRELAAKLLLKWEGDLRDQSAGWVPATAPLGTLLIHLPCDTVVDSFQRIVERSLGEGHTLYEMVERAGIAETARDLFERAEQLCDLRSRDIEAFNITPCTVTVVRLPPPVGPRDSHIRDEFAEAFLSLANCSLVEAPASERHVVSVMRAVVGWPIGIEAGNPGMLLDYSRAHELGHVPHLVGILDAAPDGDAIAEYLELATIVKS